MKTQNQFHSIHFRIFSLLGLSLLTAHCSSKFDPLYQPGLIVSTTPVSLTCSTTSAPFGGGSGTASSPYRVCSRAQLAAITGTYVDKYFIQYLDIDLGGAATPWTPLASFTGQYDGNSKTISGLYYNGAGNSVGLFGTADTGAVIKNLTISSASVTSTGGRIGALVGLATGVTIQNCSSSGSVTGDSSVGGLVGYIQTSSTVTSSSSSAAISSGDDSGGLIGYAETTAISSSYSTGSISAPTGDYIGGLIGHFDTSTLSSSYSTSAVSANRTIGGLIGTAIDNTGTATNEIQNCYATGNVTGSHPVGGLIGDIDSVDIVSSHASGTVSGGSEVGGLVGTAASLSILKSYATGTISAAAATNVGGLVGQTTTVVLTNVYSTGNVTGDTTVGGLVALTAGTTFSATYATGIVSGSSDVGGLVGKDDTTAVIILPSYWDTQTSGQATSAIGTGRTTAQMKDYNNFIGWDFATIWNGAIYGGSASIYPFLR